MIKDKENTEVLNAFFTSVFSSRTSCSLGTQSSELEYRAGKQNEAPLIQEEVAVDPQHHLDIHESMGPACMH